MLLAFRELRVNKLRTFLSLLGITIGIFCIISIFSAVDSLQSNLNKSMNKLGDNLLYINKWPWTFGADYAWWKYWKRPCAKYEEMQLISEQVPDAEHTAIAIWLDSKTLKNSSLAAENITVACVSQDYDHIQSMEFTSGRFFTPSESDGGQPVVILGSDVTDVLFPGVTDPTGREIKYEGNVLHVIGTFKREGESLLDNSLDKMAMVPFNFIAKKIHFDGFQYEPMIIVKPRPEVLLSDLKDQISGVLRPVRRLKPGEDDNFAMNQMTMITNQMDSMFGVVDIAGWIIGGFAILVGGFGVANIMFVSVRERTNLIGIKMALGAKRSFILLEFLSEAMILAVIGGAVGLLLVFLATKAASSVIAFEFVLDFKNMTMGLLISAVIGIIAGFMPALSASRLNPVEAIRFK